MDRTLASANDSAQLPRAWPWWRWTLTGLSALALALSTYLSWHHLAGGSVIGCTGGSSCDQVLSSPWSAVGGVLPVSGLAAGAYLAMLLAGFFIGPAVAAPDRRLAWGAMLLLAGAAAGSAVWFIFVQKWKVEAFCPWCMATHITGLLLAALIFWRAPRQLEEVPAGVPQTTPAPDAATPAPARNVAPAPRRRIIGPLPAIGCALLGLALAGILAAAQVGLAPKAVYRGGESQRENLPTLDPHAIPLAGSPGAPYLVTLFFDYNCSHCQRVHAMLDEAIARYNGKLAFALCPAPLNSQCNPYVAQDIDQFKDSCELARISLAVWVADHPAYAEFDRWLFSPEPGQRWHPRTAEAAQARAIEMLGQLKFDAARSDPRIDQYMQTSMRIFGSTIQGGSAVPKLLFGNRWVTPEPTDTDNLLFILQETLAVPPPPTPDPAPPDREHSANQSRGRA